MFCSNCGFNLRDDAKFCSECGAAQSSGGDHPEGAPAVRTGDIGMVKGNVSNQSHNVHYHGTEPAPLRATKTGDFCASCGVLLHDTYFRCPLCGKFNCPDCRDASSRACLGCLGQRRVGEELPESTLKNFRARAVFEKPILPQEEEALARFGVEIQAADHSFSGSVTTHLCLVVDLSGSMSRLNKYGLLQDAVKRLLDQMTSQVYLTVVTFSQGAEEVVFAEAAESLDSNDLIERIDRSRVKFGRRTELGSGLALAAIRCRQFNQNGAESVTRLYLMTDGRVHDVEVCRKYPELFVKDEIEVHAIGFGADYEHRVLRMVTQGCVGGTVKAIKNLDGIKDVFGRAGATTSNVFATGMRINFRAGHGVLLNHAYLFRPRELDVQDRLSVDSTEFNFDGWSNFEKLRNYAILFEARLPKESGRRSFVGTLVLEGSVGGENVREELPVTVARSDNPAQCTQFNSLMQKAFDSCEYRNSTRTDLRRKSLEARRDLYRLEGRDEAAIREIEEKIEQLDGLGDLALDEFSDGVSLGDPITGIGIYDSSSEIELVDPDSL